MATPPLRIWVSIHTYNTYGGNPSVSLVGRYFQSGLPRLGDAIKELEVHVYFRSSKGPKATLESIFDRYERFIDTLPYRTFSRTKGRLEIGFLSTLGSSDLVAGYGPPRLDLFANSAREITARIEEELRKRMKPSDDFQTDRFLTLIRQKLEALPRTDDELRHLTALLDKEHERERAAMDDWEKLGIDWEDYHPTCRAILDEPFFWDCTNDFAPHGNDTGADLLALYAESPARAPGTVFLERLMCDWGMSPTPRDDDEIGAVTLEEARIALAFAQIKIDGACEHEVKQLALDAIAHCRERTTREHGDWDHRAEALCLHDPCRSSGGLRRYGAPPRSTSRSGIPSGAQRLSSLSGRRR